MDPSEMLLVDIDGVRFGSIRYLMATAGSAPGIEQSELTRETEESWTDFRYS